MAEDQQQLFEPPPPKRAAPRGSGLGSEAPVVLDFAPFERKRQADQALARTLAADFELDEDDALQTVLFWRTEEACRRYLHQRWFRHEIEFRSSAPGNM